ncbi:unnamed protein product [Nippostrongylus brasiliensis]|uniref:Defensin-like protein n=1 Tax=Nippostrongylus brasiliensis TaxID=27835 RepID=A0A0N4YJY3_NIPBR|nr:unnamed protein product [Nippostrongylus brasiliensis]
MPQIVAEIDHFERLSVTRASGAVATNAPAKSVTVTYWWSVVHVCAGEVVHPADGRRQEQASEQEFAMRRIVFVTLFLRLYNVDTRLTCGVEVFTSNVMEVIVKLDCPDLLVKHQKCCMAHGKCYKKGKPWKRCDRMYCRCVFRIAGRAGGTCQVGLR